MKPIIRPWSLFEVNFLALMKDMLLTAGNFVAVFILFLFLFWFGQFLLKTKHKQLELLSDFEVALRNAVNRHLSTCAYNSAT